MKFFIPLLMICFGGSINAQHQILFDSLDIIAPGNKQVNRVSDQFSFTEGPAADKKGRIYFTDQPNDKIWLFDPQKNKLSLFLSGTGRANGLFIDRKGNIVACADEHGELRKITPNGKTSIILNNLQGKRMNGPNDLWIDKKGGIYFTDPFYRRDYWDHKEPGLETEAVYYLAQGAARPVVADADLKKPNGIIGTADGKTLYVADIGDGKTYRYQIEPDGSLTGKTLFVNQGSDGMTLDHKGNLYITGKGVTVYDKLGNKIAQIPVPANWTANVTFGGRKKNLLFITAGKGIYSLLMNVKGQ